jgi:proline dehydrogenase
MKINKLIARILVLLPERFVWIFSQKYISGKTVEKAFSKVKHLRNEKIDATIDILGEKITSHDEVLKYQKRYLDCIELAAKENLSVTFSLKPTMFGLQWDYPFCERTIRDIVKQAARFNTFVRIDMEDSSCTNLEIELFTTFYKTFPENVGIVVQAYLKRTIDDIDLLAQISMKKAPVNIRLCKGIYIEPPIKAYKQRMEIRKNYLRCFEKMLDYGLYPALATHDNYLIEQCTKLLTQRNLPSKNYEFQMLLGVTQKLRKKLINEGHRVRVYVPFGEDWFSYATRRLQENPNIIWDIVKGFLIRD